jgi:hypothetical protein
MIDLTEFSYDELVALNNDIVDRLNALDAVHALQDMAALNIGNTVSFDSKMGRQVGKVIKFNIKTVGILAENGRRWKVPPHLLTKVEEIVNPKVVQIKGKQKGGKGKRRK